MRKMLKVVIVMLLVFLVVIFPRVYVHAAEQPEQKKTLLPVPKFTASLASNGSDINVRIRKIKGVEGFEVWVQGDISYEGYRNDDPQRNLEGFTKYAVVDKDGSKNRNITLKALPKGEIVIKVRSYSGKSGEEQVYSAFSKTQEITVKKEGIGYKKSYDFSKVKKGDIIKFGAYEQDINFSNGKEPIEWVVLEKTKKAVFVVSKYLLDFMPYHSKYQDITWEYCSLREWLNEEFYRVAFNQSEKKLVRYSLLDNWDNFEYETPAGEDTEDKVFLLSYIEAEDSKYGFGKGWDPMRKCQATKYALNAEDNSATHEWWLRSPGDWENEAAQVYEDGVLWEHGEPVIWWLGIRPAMRINITNK